MKNKIAIESLSMDLLRVAIGLHRESYKMAKKFSDEALIRCTEIRSANVKPYFAKVLRNINRCLTSQPHKRTAEDALMYSVLCKNYAKKFTKKIYDGKSGKPGKSGTVLGEINSIVYN